jgi:CDP-glucose 4,6-dehydratase
MKLEKKFFRKKKFYITGFNGFKGSWMSLILDHLGAEVFGCSLNNKYNKKNERIFNLNKIIKKKEYINISNFKLLKKHIKKTKPNFIFHFAAQPIVLRSYLNPLETFKSNIVGTYNVLEIAKQLELPCLIVTSDKCYLNRKKKSFSENDHLGGDDPYSASKASAEVLVNSYIKSYNIKCISVRAGNVIGGGDWSENRLVPDIVRGIYENKKIKIRNPNQTRPWQHVLDVNWSYLSIFYNLINQKIISGSYNVGPNNSHKVISTINEIKKFKKFDLIHTKEKFKEKNNIFLNNYKSKKIGIKNFFSFKKAIKNTLTWYDVYYKDRKSIYKFSRKQIANYLFLT